MENDNQIKNQIKNTNPNIKTFANDMAEVIEGTDAGMVRNIIHEQEIREAEKRNLSPDSKRNKVFIIASFLLVAAAIATLFFFVYKKEPNTVPIEPQFASVIYNDKTAFLEVSGLSRDQVFAVIQNEIKNNELKDGGVEGIYLTIDKKIIGLRDFLTLIKSEFSLDNQYFLSDNFLIGAVESKGTKYPFILLKMRSIPDVFDSLRSFEPKMFSEARGLFGIALDKDTNYLASKAFEDGVINNKNARILYDKEGKIVLMYVYADDTSVILTNGSEAVREISARLVASQIKK
jgi:hypothetical protein